jgi:ribosomal protein S18 acetylase RimI-like enzyme
VAFATNFARVERERPLQANYEDYELTDDAARLDLERVCDLLRDTYWAGSRSRERIALSLRHSLCFGVFRGGRQVGLARVLTDQGATSYLCDVVIDPEHRSRGLGGWLMRAILEHPAVARTRMLLVTRDAQGFYRQLGFETHPYECMVRAEARSAADD